MLFNINDNLIIPQQYSKKEDRVSDFMYISHEEGFTVYTICYFNKQMFDLFVIKDDVVVNKFKVKYNKHLLPSNQEDIIELDIKYNMLKNYNIDLEPEEDLKTYLSMILPYFNKQIYSKHVIPTYRFMIDMLWVKFNKCNEVSYRRKILSILFICTMFSCGHYNIELSESIMKNKYNEFKVKL